MHAQPNIGCWSTKEGFPVVTSKKYDVNMLGLLNGMQAVLPPMIVSKTNTLMGSYHTSINLTYIFIQNAVFPRSFLLSFIDVIKVGTSNKP